MSANPNKNMPTVDRQQPCRLERVRVPEPLRHGGNPHTLGDPHVGLRAHGSGRAGLGEGGSTRGHPMYRPRASRLKDAYSRRPPPLPSQRARLRSDLGNPVNRWTLWPITHMTARKGLDGLG
jgi:hypothetical protein